MANPQAGKSLFSELDMQHIREYFADERKALDAAEEIAKNPSIFSTLFTAAFMAALRNPDTRQKISDYIKNISERTAEAQPQGPTLSIASMPKAEPMPTMQPQQPKEASLPQPEQSAGEPQKETGMTTEQLAGTQSSPTTVPTPQPLIPQFEDQGKQPEAPKSTEQNGKANGVTALYHSNVP